MLERLEAAFARERTFVSDASHELRTPLAILKIELELALREGRTVDQLEAALRSAAQETDRLSQLAEDLLVIARADQGGLAIRRDKVGAAELLGSVRERFGSRAAAQGVHVDVVAPDSLALTADRLRLEQALGNLLDNALRHSGRRIQLAAEPVGDRVELHVRDNGAGFPEDFIDSAFERFTRADAARGGGGAGLGLAIVAVVAEAHGGAVGACNRPTGGADVWLALSSPAAVTPRT
jgi:two-component system OmpR family sensor kinase